MPPVMLWTTMPRAASDAAILHASSERRPPRQWNATPCPGASHDAAVSALKRERQKPRASDPLTRMLVGLAHIDKHELAARNARLQVARGDLEEGRS
jgi:hypothetical protein